MITRNTKWSLPRRNAAVLSLRHSTRRDAMLELFQVIYNYFREHGGEWPSRSYIERWFDCYKDDLDVVKIISRASPTYIRSVRNVDDDADSEERLILSVAAVACCRGSADDVANFMSALQYLGKRETGDISGRELKHGMRITEDGLANALDLPLASDANSIKRLIELLNAEGVVSSNEYS
jgi:hypothetical protein